MMTQRSADRTLRDETKSRRKSRAFSAVLFNGTLIHVGKGFECRVCNLLEITKNC